MKTLEEKGVREKGMGNDGIVFQETQPSGVLSKKLILDGNVMGFPTSGWGG